MVKKTELKPVISNGKIISVQVQKGGEEYNAAPDLEVVGFGTAIGAKLRAVVVNQKVTDVVVLNTGIGYTAATTSIKVTSRGSNASLEATVRHLTLNNHERHGNEILVDTEDGLQYGMVGYSTAIGLSEFGDNSIDHSPIIGWAYDGNPIYGPYGYQTPTGGAIQRLQSGYILDTTLRSGLRPPGFAFGYFVNDYIFDNSGDLDVHGGRYCVTPQYPRWSLCLLL